MAKATSSQYTVPLDTPICELNCRAAFENLTPKERLYAHYFARASFEGGLIIPLQVSPESGGIFVILHRLFSSEPIESLMEKAFAVGFTEVEWQDFLMWTAFFFYNGGNYRGFGDSKFIPSVAAEKLNMLVASSKAASLFTDLLSIYKTVEKGIYHVDKKNSQLGFNDSGMTTYHSESVTKADSDIINRYMKEKNIELWNTRLFKEEVNGKTILTLKTASIDCGSTEDEFEGVKIKLEKGDFGGILALVCPLLQKAGEHSANEKQKAIMNKFAEHFKNGELRDHREASRMWIKDKNPQVESFAGFMREYRDPSGMRAEFMGIVAAVNKETSKKFAQLVEKAETILPKLPWGRSYEKDIFLQPDFTALDVIACATSLIALGWIIPHMYNDIKQNEGFKNLSLSNSLNAMPKQKMIFASKEDEKLLHEYAKMALDVQIGLHELLGHGSGKLFERKADGTFNFDKENTVDILTGGKVTSWYEPGETWESLFGSLCGGIEECRCEAVGYVLSCDDDCLKIFGYEGELAQRIKYVNWLSNVHRGLIGLTMYSADSRKWGQPHSWARFILMKVVLEAGQGFVTIEETTDSDGGADLSFKLDKTKIDSVGMPAVREFVKKLQAYKSTANVKEATALFEKYGVNSTDLKWRDIVLAKEQPRRFFVQSNTKLTRDGKNVELVNYPETPEGVIQSTVERYSADSISALEKLWKEDQKHFPRAYEKC